MRARAKAPGGIAGRQCYRLACSLHFCPQGGTPGNLGDAPEGRLSEAMGEVSEPLAAERLRAELEALNAAKKKLQMEHAKLSRELEKRGEEVIVLKQRLSRYEFTFSVPS